ncbi:hypothetical protein D3C81_1657510 [compost metagenome]
MGDLVGAGHGNRDAQADAGEALLVAVDGLFGGERGFKRGHVGFQLIPADTVFRNLRFDQGPEAFARPVVGEDDRLGGIEATLRIEDAHVVRRVGIAQTRADGLRCAQLQLHVTGVLVPHGVTTGRGGVGPLVDSRQAGGGAACDAEGERQGAQGQTWPLVVHKCLQAFDVGTDGVTGRCPRFRYRCRRWRISPARFPAGSA